MHDEELWAAISDPANSDLPPALFAEVTQLGIAVVTADATGHGRDRFPHYWNTYGHAQACCQNITVLAAGAHTDPHVTTRTQVIVVWTAQHAVRGRYIQQTSIVRFEQRGEAWRPVVSPR